MSNQTRSSERAYKEGCVRYRIGHSEVGIWDDAVRDHLLNCVVPVHCRSTGAEAFVSITGGGRSGDRRCVVQRAFETQAQRGVNVADSAPETRTGGRTRCRIIHEIERNSGIDSHMSAELMAEVGVELKNLPK